ncbi:hypothetical protein RHMOL_Rhmol10G0173400 [Rhododendron molle]|uniref:Uncharacterized protein n=1 Tax=Rhododendron molle TaxID=49168 RepID=A0ACC0M4E5_RHOML|nr:hypothetical protein RHMOL_Rhmol10G0173400 [Rhododendron molle]
MSSVHRLHHSPIQGPSPPDGLMYMPRGSWFTTNPRRPRRKTRDAFVTAEEMCAMRFVPLLRCFRSC